MLQELYQAEFGEQEHFVGKEPATLVVGRVEVALHDDCSKTKANFEALCTGEKGACDLATIKTSAPYAQFALSSQLMDV